MQDQEVTPYMVSAGTSGLNYDKLILQFGTEPLTEELLHRFQRLTKKPLHCFLRRRMFISHRCAVLPAARNTFRSLDEILDHVEKGQPFYLFTGRGPSSEGLHLGHLIPFIFAKYLQEVFDVPLVIQITDDEEFFFRSLTLEEAHNLAIENAKDIIAMGFDVERTFIFTDRDYIGKMYPNIAKIQKLLTANQVRAALGLLTTGEDNVGKYAYSAVQAAPSFSSSFPDIFGPASSLPVLVPCGIDQDAFFRMTRDVAPRLHPGGYLKPAIIHSKFFPSLRGVNSKMSASDPTGAIFLTDTAKEIATKVNKYAFSGGRDTVEEHRRLGANVAVDVSIAYLEVFLEDDEKLSHITEAYRKGELLTSDVKGELIRILQPIIAAHQAVRKAVTTEQVEKFFAPRALRCYGKSLAPIRHAYKPTQ